MNVLEEEDDDDQALLEKFGSMAIGKGEMGYNNEWVRSTD